MSARQSARKDRAHARRRRAVLRKASAAGNMQAMLVTRPEDVGYLSGFSGDDSFLLIAGGWACLITDGRYAEQAKAECGDVEVRVRRSLIFDAVARALHGRGVRTLGVQAGHMTLRERELLQAAIGRRRICETLGAVAQLRTVKDDGEVRAIRRAVRVAERAFEQLTARGAKAFAGRSERDVAAELDYLMRVAGADGSSFETIVAAGAHAAFPHYRPGATKIHRPEAVLIDWGARVKGYCSDLTRVVFIGRIPPKLAEVYEVVRRAQRAGIATVRPGVRCGTPHAAACEVIERAGYGERFVHGLGHGVGRVVHEGPVLGRDVKMRLRAGMVVTIEPGIYLPGVGGVRIEDDVLVTAGGCRRLSRLSRDIDDMVLR